MKWEPGRNVKIGLTMAAALLVIMMVGFTVFVTQCSAPEIQPVATEQAGD